MLDDKGKNLELDEAKEPRKLNDFQKSRIMNRMMKTQNSVTSKQDDSNLEHRIARQKATERIKKMSDVLQKDRNIREGTNPRALRRGKLDSKSIYDRQVKQDRKAARNERIQDRGEDVLRSVQGKTVKKPQQSVSVRPTAKTSKVTKLPSQVNSLPQDQDHPDPIINKGRKILRDMRKEEMELRMEMYIRSLGGSMSMKVTPNEKKKKER